MLAQTTLFGLIGALSVAAIHPYHIQSRVLRKAGPLIHRQTDTSAIPGACQQTCASSITIFDACSAITSDNSTDATATCLSICGDQFNAFIGCYNCVVENSPGIDDLDYEDIQGAIASFRESCALVGQSITATASLVPFESLSLTAPRTISDNFSFGSGSSTVSTTSTESSSNSTESAITEAITSTSSDLSSSSEQLSASSSASGSASATASASSIRASISSAIASATSVLPSITSRASNSISASSAAATTSQASAAPQLQINLFTPGIAIVLTAIGAGAAFIL